MIKNTNLLVKICNQFSLNYRECNFDVVNLFYFSESDVYGGVNSTEETSTEFTNDYTDRPPQTVHRQPPQTTQRGTSVNENCNASTPPMRVFPQEVHHYHHHYLPTLAPNGGCAPPPHGGQFGGGGGAGSSSSPYGGPGGGSFNVPGDAQGGANSIAQLTHQMRQVMIALENMKLKVATLSEVVDELINSNSNTKLLLTGANVDSTTNLFDLVRHIILDRLELKDLKNDIYSATRIKKGIVFDVASGLDKRRILARARERFHGEEEELRITDYYDGEQKPDGSSESVLDTRFGGSDDDE